MKSSLKNICIGLEGTIKQAIICINKNEKGIVLVVDTYGALIDTITDGDTRRAILAGYKLENLFRLLAGLLCIFFC